MKLIEVVPYNVDWPEIFKVEAAKISEVLKHNCLEIHHVGSTAVPGLAAKQEIDILCIVDQLSSALKLQEIGYIFKGELNIPLRYFLSKNTSFAKVNLHVVEQGHSFIVQQLSFRDYLRKHEDARNDYSDLKTNLVRDPISHTIINSKFTRYTLEKNQFIKEILAKAGFNELCVNFCLHDREWEIYHKIREEELFVPINVIYDRNHSSLTADNHFHFVLYKGTIIVCAAHVQFLNEKEAVLRSLATKDEFQRKGFGAYMLNFLEKRIQHHGRNIIKMHSRLSAESFYRRLGYREMIFNDPEQSILETYINLGKRL